MRIFFVLASFIFFYSVAYAVIQEKNIWYVKVSGLDTEDCSGGRNWENAFKTIQKAVDCAADRDEIWVEEGNYILRDHISINKSVDIYGGFKGIETSFDERNWSAHPTILDGNNTYRYYGGCLVISDNVEVIIDGINFTNGYAKWGGAIRLGSYNKSPQVVLINCNVYDNQAVNSSDGAIFIYSGTVKVINTNVYSNKGVGGNGIYRFGGNVYVINSNIYGNEEYGIYGNNVNVQNSVIWGNLKGQVYGLNVIISYSDIQGGYAGEENIDARPSFIDPNGGDFHLKCDSPCIDAGYNFEDLPDKDFEGDGRILDGNNDTDAVVDIGADEFKFLGFCDDGDGVDAEIENQVPNAYGNGKGDGNGDGIADFKQSNVTSLKDETGRHYVTIENKKSNDTEGYQQQDVQIYKPKGDVPSNITFPYGMYTFTISGLNNESVIVKVYVPKNERITGYWKKNLDTGKWVNIAESVEHGPEYAPDKTVVTFMLVDNSNYDSDRKLGIIKDPGGPGYLNNAFAVPVFNWWGIIILSLVLCILSYIFIFREGT